MLRANLLLMALALVATMVGLEGVAPANAASTGVTVAGGNGAGMADNQMTHPMGLVLDNHGNIYVADQANNRVQRWAPGATSGLTVAGGNGQGSAANQLDTPGDVALDGHGNVYVADSFNRRIQRWAPGATFGVTVAGGIQSTELGIPVSITLDGSGNLYIADILFRRVQRWAPGATSGVTVAGGNGNGSADNQIAAPTAVEVDTDGTVYVGDGLNSRVQRWAPGATSGVTVAGGNGQGSASNQLAGPNGLALDGTGHLYVADYANNRVQRWAPGATSGVTVAGGNGAGSAPNQLSNPAGVALDDGNNLYVSDYANYRVQLWITEQTIVPGSTSKAEGNSATSTLGVPVTLSNPSTQTVTVQWTTVPVPGDRPDQADPTTDYAAASGTVNGDTLVEPDEYVIVSFHDPTNATMGGFWGIGIAYIINDDHAVVTPAAGSTTEGNTGTTTLAVPVTLSNPSTQTVTVQWTTVPVPGDRPDQADPTTDYAAASGTVNFNPGETDKTVSITVNGDTLVEPDEYVIVSFHDPTNATMGGFWGLGIAYLINDD
jgi:hypothetical protein